MGTNETDANDIAYSDNNAFFLEYGSAQFILYSWRGDKFELSLDALYEAFKRRLLSELTG